MRQITDSKLDKYFSVTERAIEKAKANHDGGKVALDFLDMAERYLSDARHFRQKGDYVSAFGAVNYAHAWLDAGARIGAFRVNDSSLFASD
ncbi:DUF357 domain-containing protein [Candidatus Woesearchaeota archaeon]|nr:DUF357 domain-containing protein [Candidatus Woesearchaeota archaeon]